MKSVAKLRRIGFTIAASQPDLAVGCTQVESPKPFYFFNPKFASTPLEVFNKLEAAKEVTPGVFRVVIAGEYFGDNDDLPYTLMLPASQQSLARYHQKYEAAKNEVDRLKEEVKQAEDAVTFELETFEALTKSIIGD